MRKTVFVPLVVMAVYAFVATGVSVAAMHEKDEHHGNIDDVKLQVNLSGIHDVKTEAKGEATFSMARDGSSLHYKLHLGNIKNVTMAHIHAVGEGGSPGPVIAWLYPAGGGGPSLKEGEFSGSLAKGDITPDKLAGKWKGKSIKELFAGIAHGKAGVAVHTRQNPGTELWGVYRHPGREHMEREHMERERMEQERGKTGY